MNEQTKFLYLAIAAIVIAVLAIFIATQGQQVMLGGRSAGFSGGVTNASTTVATSSTSILSANRTRQYAIICNNDGTNFINMSFHASAAVATNGIKLEAGECYEIDRNNLYVGTVYGIADTAAVVVTTLEK